MNLLLFGEHVPFGGLLLVAPSVVRFRTEIYYYVDTGHTEQDSISSAVVGFIIFTVNVGTDNAL